MVAGRKSPARPPPSQPGSSTTDRNSLANPEELLQKRVLNRATFERIKDQVTAN
jgi:hypothetical protein